MKKIRITTNNSTSHIPRHSISQRLKRAFLRLRQKTLTNFMGYDQKSAQLPFRKNKTGDIAVQLNGYEKQ